MDLKRYTERFLLLVLVTSLLLVEVPTSDVAGEAEVKPSKGWGMFFETTGDVNISMTEPGVAVRIEVPRQFLDGVIARSNRQKTNDTSFIKSDISSDYYYYSLIDQSEYYPYDANSPYTIEIQTPPDCSGVIHSFTPPKHVLLQGLKAPEIAGVYNFTVYIALSVDSRGKPVFPPSPNKVLQIPVSMREDPGYISGRVVDSTAKKYIKAKGVVYAVEADTGMKGKGFVNDTTGFFNITGLYRGEYYLEGSAGYFQETGYAYAPTISATTYRIEKGQGQENLNFSLNRGCIINGSITYADGLGNPIQPLESPYLKALNYQGLNYTVEAYDESGTIVASRTYRSSNTPTEKYVLMLRNGTRHVGYPALGTEYAGFGPGTYRVKTWVYGFTLPVGQVKTVTFTGYGHITDVGESRLPYGGVVSGKVRLRSGPLGTLETPLEGEARSFGSSTGTYFGGNILVEMYSGEGVLRGLTVLNRTLPDGVVQYANYSSGDQTPLLRFYVLGFSEFHNKTYSGSWVVGSYPGPSPWDYGIEGGTYYLRLSIRGYVQETIGTFAVGDGGNTSVTVDLRRGGSVQMTVASVVVKPGTRLPQAPIRWEWMDLCPAPRLRIYFYESSGLEVGYTETVLAPGSLGVTNTTATLSFTGHNWPIEDIILQGYVPNALRTNDYKVKGYTYGYVQTYDVTASVSLTPFSPTHTRIAFPLMDGCGINGAVSLFMNGVSVALTEDVTVRPQVTLGGTLMGVDVADVPAGSLGFSFSTYGFYGRGHFFYVDPDGVRWKDYGLDSGRHEVSVPDFGLDRRFTQTIDIHADLPELGWGAGVFFDVERMIKITGVIDGYNMYHLPVQLVWASATTNGYVSHSFDGDFYMHMPAGTYTVTFSCPGYGDALRTVTTDDQASVGIVVLEQSGTPFP